MLSRTRTGFVALWVILSLFQEIPSIAAHLEADEAVAFLRALAVHPDSLDTFIDRNDLATANRLAISYPEAPCKPLISWDLNQEGRDRLLRDGPEGHFTIQELDDHHSRLILFPADSTATRSWVFRDGLVVSSILYRVRDWKQVDSPHFRFFISDTTRFHPANIEALEAFVTDMASRLELIEADMNRLARQKIYYCFCSNHKERKELTGFVARGMYVVSHDIVVSTYSAHLHELAHLLMNFKLRRPHLYTHPLFLEGFAVAVGGRGGKSPDILHQLGLSIHRQEWLSLDELLGAGEFYQVNASMSYPGSAVYNRFLMEKLSMEDYLELYARHGGDARSLLSMKINPVELPDEAAWKQYLDDQPTEGVVLPGAPGLDTAAGPVAFRPLPGGTQFGFALEDTLLVFDGPPATGYRSFLFDDFFEDGLYGGQRYFIRASSGEAAVYDLFTNTMIALYASGFSDDMAEIPAVDGLNLFRVNRSVFPRPPRRE